MTCEEWLKKRKEEEEKNKAKPWSYDNYLDPLHVRDGLDEIADIDISSECPMCFVFVRAMKDMLNIISRCRDAYR